MSATKTYLSCAESAVILRQALKTNFPSIKFSVRSKTYSGGASIRVNWVDGPVTARVQAITSRYEGASFDGMTDSTSYHSAILVGPDGPREVQFGSNYIFCERDFSDEATQHAAAEAFVRAHCTLDAHGRFGRDSVADYAWSLMRARDYLAGDTLDTVFARRLTGGR